jgi:hypothetical protein
MALQPPTSAVSRSLVIRITLTQAAFDAIAATLPSSVGVEQNRAPNGDYFIWLEPNVVDRLRALRAWRVLQRRHSAAGEDQPLAGRVGYVSAVGQSCLRLIGARRLSGQRLPEHEAGAFPNLKAVERAFAL